MIKPIFFSDLDAFLFDLEENCDNPVQPAAVDDKGQPRSFMNPTQVMFLEWLLATTRVVPTTGRGSLAFKRVTVKFEEPAICSFGGTILMPDGTPEPRWYDHIKAESQAVSETLHALKALVDQEAAATGFAVKGSVIADFGLDMYIKVLATNKVAPVEQFNHMAELLKEALPAGWRLHHNGTQVAVLPPFLRKENAVDFYMKHLAGQYSFVMGGGDSLSDMEFIQRAAYGIVPNGSQAFDSLIAAAQSHGQM